MAYTDFQLKNASQVAYLNLQEAVKSLMVDGRKSPFTLRELISEYIDFDLAKTDLRWEGKKLIDFKLQNLVQYSSMRELDKKIVNNLPDEVLDWKIVDIHDTIHDNGFYSCVIETSEENAIVAFRGSEGIKNYSGLVNDWIKADIGLLNSKETEQQKEVERLAEEFVKRNVLEKYKNIASTGHSLGGNLASHFAIASSYGAKKSIFDKIKQVVNFDGPGCSGEYINYFEEGIKKAGSKIVHYSWSPVGKILNSIPGEKCEELAVSEYSGKESILEKIKYCTFFKHDTKSLMFDENGKAIRGKVSTFDKVFGKFTKAIDKIIPASLTYQIYTIASAEFSKFAYEKENGSIGFNPFPMFFKKGKKLNNSELAIKCGNMKEGLVNCLKTNANLLAKSMNFYRNGNENDLICEGR